MPKPRTERRIVRSHALSPGQGELGFDVRRSSHSAPPSGSIDSLITDTARRIAQEAPPLTGLQCDRLRVLLQPAPLSSAPRDSAKRSRSRTAAA